MELERAMELLNQIVNHISSANNTSETINELINSGFEEEELIKYFGFSESDIENYKSWVSR